MPDRPPAHAAEPALRRASALRIALAWLAPLLAVSAWIAVDADHRDLQLVVLAAVSLCAGVHATLGSSRRGAHTRWEVTDEELYTQDGPGRRRRSVVPLSALTSVERRAGFVERAFELRTVVVTSPRGRTRVRGLSPRTARTLVDRLTSHVSADGERPPTAT